MTNSFIGSVMPVIPHTPEEEAEALQILGMTTAGIVCAYCGGKYTESDHFRPFVMKRQPTGYFTTIGNLVPSCGTCNQSKGNKYWKDWLVQRHQGAPGLDGRVKRLEAYETWRDGAPLPVIDLIGKERWENYMKKLDEILDLMRKADAESQELKSLISGKLRETIVP